MVKTALHSIIHIIYILIVLAGVYVLYLRAFAPFVPVVKAMLRDGVSLSVAFDSVSINGIAFSSLYDMAMNAAVSIIIFSIAFFILTLVHNILRKII